MEFVQFHPTALSIKGAPRFLLSEALRGEGALLRNMTLHRFMPKYHDLAELAPRDVVARAITHELELSGSPDAVVYLDLTHLDPDRIRARFPLIYSTCMRYNIDITAEVVPIRPAAHYAMGGVRTDLDGRTSVAALYAAGECAATGVHGANRLASNSLLEGLVYGARAARTLALEAGRSLRAESSNGISSSRKPEAVTSSDVEKLIQSAQNLMWQKVGVVREGKHLREAITALKDLRAQLPEPGTRRFCEAINIVETGSLIARMALAREESRGAHYRLDFPLHDDARYLKHSLLEGNKISFEAPAVTLSSGT
jgi:L-aspartate oxidase